jgi:hypothetical protein
VLLLWAAPAQAADFWVDDSGNDSGMFQFCTTPTAPCQTLANAISWAEAHPDQLNTIHVGGGSYAGNLTLPPGISLLKDAWSFAGTGGTATVDGGPSPAVTIPEGTPARSISGDFVLRGNDDGTALQAPVVVQGGADPGHVTIDGATFNEVGTSMTGIPVQILILGGSPKVLGSTFTGVDQDMETRAISYLGEGAPEFGGNMITTFRVGISISDTAPAGFPVANIHDNVITDLYEAGAMTPIGIAAANGQMAANLIRGKSGETTGIGVFLCCTGPPDAPSTFARNRIHDIPSGVIVSTDDAVSFSSDVIANTGLAIQVFANPGGVSATGLTATHSTNSGFGEISIQDAALTLSSSLIGDEGVFLGGAATCTSSFSRGPAVPDDCGFATVADPLFRDPGNDDFHLLPASPMIDMGDPAPAAGQLDVDGDPRALMGIPSCAPRRDIGADEFLPATPIPPLNCGPPSTAPSPPTKRKKCKKKRKQRAADVAKKKRCKKKKKRR